MVSGKVGLLVGGMILSTLGLYATYKTDAQKALLPNIIDVRLADTLARTQSIPGVSSDKLSVLKPEILKSWDILVKDGVLEITGADEQVRPYFVSLQGLIEFVLASELQGNVKSIKGYIHTPMPATPLCSEGEISKDLVDPSIETDPLRLFTVAARTVIVRDYLFKGGQLYVIYPKEGLLKRTEEQQLIYKRELTNYPDRLFDIQLNTDNIPTELIGATYLFQDQSSNTYMFAIQMTQAKDPQENGHFGLWFGPIDHPNIQKRWQAVSTYLQAQGVNVL